MLARDAARASSPASTRSQCARLSLRRARRSCAAAPSSAARQGRRGRLLRILGVEHAQRIGLEPRARVGADGRSRAGASHSSQRLAVDAARLGACRRCSRATVQVLEAPGLEHVDEQRDHLDVGGRRRRCRSPRRRSARTGGSGPSAGGRSGTSGPCTTGGGSAPGPPSPCSR